MGIMVRERPHESALMEVQTREYVCGELEPELQLPCGWEKCLDLKSGLIYFKDWNSGTMTYRDPRQVVPVPVATQRIGLLSISLPAESNASEGARGKRAKRRREAEAEAEGDSSGTEATTTTTTTSSMEDDGSLELSLTLPGTSVADESVCTMEKVRSALERSNWLRAAASPAPPKKRHTPRSLLSPRPSSPSRRRDSHSPRHSSASTSQCSSDCFTSPSIMSYEGDDEEVQQRPRLRGDYTGAKRMDSAAVSWASAEVMVAVGCKSCLMYVMLSKAHPSCPKCGNTDVLLELPAPAPQKRRVSSALAESVPSPTWSWCAA